MNDFPKWPHLENLDRVLTEHCPSFLAEDKNSLPPVEWVVTEKIHGFNARFGRLSNDVGTPWVGSRNNVVAQGVITAWDRGGLQGFVGFAADHVMRLYPGETAFGEWAGKGIQKGIDYGEPTFRLFGSMADGVLDSWMVVRFVSIALGCETVPVLYRGSEPPPLDLLTELRDQRSILAEQDREGVVIYRWPVPLNAYGPVIAKFKSPAFSEVSRAPKAAKELPDVAQVMSLVDRYATPQRMEHVLDQCRDILNPSREPGRNDVLHPEYTGLALRAMHDDIVREAGSEFTELSEEAQKAFGKALNPTTKRLLDAARLTAATAS